MATIEQLENGLRKAHAAGNADHAKRFADEIRRMRSEGASVAPQQPAQPAAAPAPPQDAIARYEAAQAAAYGGTGTDRYGRQGQGAEMPGPIAGLTTSGGPSIEQMNAQNRADVAAPGFREQQQAATVGNQQQAFQEVNPLMQGIVGAGSRIPLRAMAAGQMLGVTDEQDVARQREQMQFMEGSLPASIGKGAADVAMALLPATHIAKLPSFAARLGGNAAVGGALGALTPTGEGESRAMNTSLGAAFGAGGELLGKGLGIAASGAKNIASKEVRALYEAAKARGITLTPAQLSDSKLLQYLGDRMRMYPGSGGASRTADQVGKWNESLASTLGEKAKQLTPEVFAGAKARIGKTFNDLTSRNNLNVDDALRERLNVIKQEAIDLADDNTGIAVSGVISRLLAQAKEGVLPGRAYQSLDSQIGRITKAGGEKSLYLSQIRDALREQMDASITGADKAAWQTARAQWRALKTVEPLVAKSDTGVISPASLMGRVTANNAGKSSMAAGTAGELGELARIGQRIKPPPSSGTSERQLADSLFNPLNWPALGARTALGATVGRIPNSTALSRLLMGGGPAAALTALSRLAPGTGIAAGQLAAPVVAKERKRIK